MKKLAPWLIILAGCSWGTISLFVLFFDVMQITDNIAKLFIRDFGAAVILVIFTLFFNKSLLKIKLKDIWVFFGSGFLCVFGFNVFFYYNIVNTSANFALVMLYTSPIWVMIMSSILFKEKLTKIKLTALVLAVIGCSLVSGIFGGLGSVGGLAILFGIISGFGYGMYTIFSNIAFKKGYSNLTVNVWSFIFATIGCLVVGVQWGQMGYALQQAPAFSFFIMLLYAAVSSAIPYGLYTLGLKHVEAGKASILASTDPLVGSLGAFFVFSQNPGAFGWFGMAAIIIAVVILNIRQNNQKNEVVSNGAAG